QPVLVLADEPTSGLDPATARSLLRSLRACAERGAAVLVVTHDAAVTGACDRRHVLDDGVLSAVDARAAGTQGAVREGEPAGDGGVCTPGGATGGRCAGRCPCSPCSRRW